jgi:membrane fusion protein (multidrug efflux system)
MRFKTVWPLFMLLPLLSLSSCGNDQAAERPPIDIEVYQVTEQEIPIFQEFVGQIYGYKDIAIRARVEGFLEGIHFLEGSQVKKSVLLYTLESQPFEADVAAKMSMVAEAKTMLAKAQSDLARIRPLAEQKAVSESDLDTAVAMFEAAGASVEAAEANLRASNIQLGYTKMYSPIDGIIGKTSAKVGDFVGRSPNPVILNVVSRIDTILVEFFITETQYLQIARRARSRLSATAPREERPELDLILADGSFYEHKGRVDFIDRDVDPTTGAMLVQASFPNPDGLIRTGQFGRIKALMYVVEDGIMVPQRCITELQGMHRIHVVDENNVVEIREVKTGPTIHDFWYILEGLSAGEKVVYEGLQLVRPGMTVNPIVKDIQPTISEKQ